MTRPTDTEIRNLADTLRLRATVIKMNYLHHPVADDLRKAADILEALTTQETQK